MAQSQSSEPVRAPERVVSGWVKAFNARDLDGMLSVLSSEVDFHPLRLGGLGTRYRGHDGVRDWFARLERFRYEHRIAISELRAVGDGRVLATGALSLAGELDIGSFCALHRVADGLIVTADHYLTDPDMMEHLGLIP